jgi:carboxymethylenebutenolidase
VTHTDSAADLFATAIPSGPSRGRVVVLHDIFGVSDYVVDVLNGLAEHGWSAVAPALFHRDGIAAVPYADMDTGSLASARLTESGVLEDVDTGLELLRELGSPDGVPTTVIGFCLGGALASYVATARPLASVVCFYGAVTTSEADGMPPLVDSIPEIGAPWLGIYGEDDPFIPASDVQLLNSSLDRFQVPSRLTTYPGGHAFHRHTTPDFYHPRSAEAAWREAMAWIANSGSAA